MDRSVAATVAPVVEANRFGPMEIRARMSAKLFCVAVVSGLSLGLLTTASPAPHSDEAAHPGKSVEQWFQEYVAGADTRISLTSPSVRNGEFLRPSSNAEKPDPAWQAFKTLGEKAVPCLVSHLRSGSRDLSGGPTAAQLSTAAQPELPDPGRMRLERRQAIELIYRLGRCARAATPALLALLPNAAEPETDEVCAALRSIGPDRQASNQFLLDFGKSGREGDLLQFTRRLGWSGPEVARLLGELLRSPNSETCRGAITLLDAAGEAARPAASQIIEVLKHPDPEIRYLAARSLSQLTPPTPAALKALQTLAEDRDEMVRTVARRALAQSERNAPQLPVAK